MKYSIYEMDNLSDNDYIHTSRLQLEVDRESEKLSKMVY